MGSARAHCLATGPRATGPRQHIPNAFHHTYVAFTLSHKRSQSTTSAASRRPVVAASSNGASSSVAAAKPSPAETARTIVDLVAHGTLCTSGDEGIPLGTYVSYVLDGEGQPILRLRSDAVHTSNLQKDSRCSLFVQPGEHPARLLARVTLIGSVEPVTEDVATSAADLHSRLHAGGVGVDAPQPTDLYYRLNVERCFYVGGLSGESVADVISGSDYRSAEPDPLRTFAASLVEQMNGTRLEDVIRIGCRAMETAFENLYYAELLWVDRLGAYVKGVGQDGGCKIVRVPFMRPVEDERDTQSALTMMAQVAWEEERPYAPQPVIAESD